jgi:hypothetical protein
VPLTKNRGSLGREGGVGRDVGPVALRPLDDRLQRSLGDQPGLRLTLRRERVLLRHGHRRQHGAGADRDEQHGDQHLDHGEAGLTAAPRFTHCGGSPRR